MEEENIQIKNILVPISSNFFPNLALARSKDLAKKFGAKVHVLYIMEKRYLAALEEKALEFLKSYTHARMLEYGKTQAGKADDVSLHAYTDQFRDLDRYKNSLVMEIVEDTDKAFELKVTERICH